MMDALALMATGLVYVVGVGLGLVIIGISASAMTRVLDWAAKETDRE